MAGPTKPAPRRSYAVSCRCGSRLTIDSGAFGQPHVCPKCGSTITVAWGRDPRTREKAPAVTIQPPRVKRGAADRTPFTAFCGCGYSRPVPPEEADTTPPCPGCGKLMVVERAPDPRELQKLYQAKKPRTAAPPVPLYLRPPIRVQVAHDAQHFECPCGERILIRSEAPAKSIQCPACERHHVVERLQPPYAAPATKTGRRGAARAGAAPPTAPRPQRQLRLGEFVCKCGAIQPPRTSRTGREFTCAACGRSGRIEMVENPKTKDFAIRVFITSEPASP